MILIRDNAAAAQAVFDATGGTPSAPFSGFLVQDEEGRTHGVAILSNHTDKANVELSAIGRMCWTPSVVRQLAHIAFGVFGCRRVSARTRADNARALRALKAMGFQQEGVLREYYADGTDALHFGLLRREQRIVRL